MGPLYYTPAAFFSASSMRVCQPGPSALKRSTTSRVRRSETATLVGCFRGPRPRRLSASAGNACANAFARRKSCVVLSGLLGSAAMPAWLRASAASESARLALMVCHAASFLPGSLGAGYATLNRSSTALVFAAMFFISIVRKLNVTFSSLRLSRVAS